MALDDNDLLQQGRLPDDPAAGAVRCTESRPPIADADWDDPISLLAVPDPPRFPVPALSAALEQLVLCASEAIQVPVDLASFVALGVLAASVGNRITVRVRDDYSEYLNLYQMVALDSGERKSSLLTLLRAPVERFERSCQERWTQSVCRANRERQLLEKQRDRLMRDFHQGKPEGPRDELNEQLDRLDSELEKLGSPAVPRVLFENVTPEEQVSLLSRQGGQLAAIDSDLDFKTMMGIRYGGRAGQNISILLKAYSGEDLRLDRVSRGSVHVRRPLLTLILPVQPHVMAEFLANEEVIDRGLAARFLFSVPPGIAGYRHYDPPPDPIPQEVLEGFYTTVTQLLAFSRPGIATKEPSPPAELRLSTGATEAYQRYAAACERELRLVGRLGASSLRAWGARLAAHAIKIAGLLHLSGAGEPLSMLSVPISAGTMDAAIEICRYAEVHAKIAFGKSGFDKTTRFANRVLASLAENWTSGMTASDIFNKLRCSDFDDMEAFWPILHKLEEHGMIQFALVPPSGPKGGRKRSPKLELHPALRGSRST